MKKIIIISFAILSCAVILFFIFSPSKSSENQNAQKINSSDISSEINSGNVVLLDVRTPGEFNSGHSEKAINFDSVRIDKGELPNISKDTKIYLYCRSGNRATQVKNSLEAQGYNNVVNLGGLSQMQSLGLL